MADSEIAGMVNPDWLDKIKAGGDKHPFIAAFTIAHDGDSDVFLNGIHTPIRWMRSAIGWINNRLQLRTPVFSHHGPLGDNSHEGRVKIGEIVGKKLTDMGNKIATIAAMYIFPQFRHLTLDVASIEADIRYAKEGDVVWPTGIDQITGIALSDSRISKPGFPDATLLGSIAAFAREKENTMTIEEIKSAIASQGIAPEQLFSESTIISSQAVKTHVGKEKTNVYEHAQRVERERDDARDELVKSKTSHAEEIKVLKVNGLKGQATNVFSAIASERNMDTDEKAYVDIQLNKFQSESTEPNDFRSDLNKFVDGELENLEKIREPLGLKKKEPVREPVTEPAATTPRSTESERPFRKYENPDTNVLIPGGKADKEYEKT